MKEIGEPLVSKFNQLLDSTTIMSDNVKSAVRKYVQSFHILIGYPDYISNEKTIDELYKPIAIRQGDDFLHMVVESRVTLRKKLRTLSRQFNG